MKCLVKTKILFHAPVRFSCPAQAFIRENWQVKMFAVAGYQAVVCQKSSGLILSSDCSLKGQAKLGLHSLLN